MDVLQDKAYKFALRIVRLSEYLNNDKKEFLLSKKILDAGTNIGLFIEDGKQGENRADFIQKYVFANKEAFKTNFLIRVVRDCDFIGSALSESLLRDCGELQGLLITSVRTAKKNE